MDDEDEEMEEEVSQDRTRSSKDRRAVLAMMMVCSHQGKGGEEGWMLKVM